MRPAITRTVAASLFGLVLALACMVRRALVLHPRRMATEPLDTAAVDIERLSEALGRAIRHQTIAAPASGPETATFLALHADLRALFPRVHASLECELIGDLSLLYTWHGSSPELEPIVLAAHQDVVPVDPGTETAWGQPPFSGAIESGDVWGRGALDDKGSLVAILAAVEDLLDEGFVPRRPILLAFGHDEEVGGATGAKAVAAELTARGVRAALVLDEGGAVSEGVMPGVGPVALIGVAEKGFVSLELVAEAPGGHSSMPPRQSAVGIVAQAVRSLETSRLAARMVPETLATLEAIAPELPFLPRLVFANLDILERPVLAAFARRPALDAATRTTTAATLISGGSQSNVLPKHARAVVNFRILPGETVGDVVAHARRSIADRRVRIRLAPGTIARDPSPASPSHGPAFALLEETIGVRFPDAVVAPYLVLGGTDARHYAPISDNVYRFLPIRLDAAARSRLHGTDERVSADELADAVRFYRELIRRAQRDL